MESHCSENMVLSCYFTSKPDPVAQRSERDRRDPQKAHYRTRRTLLPDARGLLERWRASVVRLGLDAVVFHDGLSAGFISAMETPGVRFRYWKPGPRPVCDERFFCYQEYLRERPGIQKVFATDLFDLDFFSDPFGLVLPEFDLYAGSEQRYNWWWMWRKYRASYGKMHYPGRRLLNAGILGGTRENVLRLLSRMTSDMRGMDPFQNVNMAVFNKCAYDLFPAVRIFTGKRLHSRFRKYEQGGGFAIRHK